jgi:hypothetical protein
MAGHGAVAAWRSLSVLAHVVTLLLLSAACARQPRAATATAEAGADTASLGATESTAATLEIKLYFGDAAVIQVSDCRATNAVIRKIAKTPRVADAVLRLLFQGVTAEEKKAGLSDSFAGLMDPQSQPVEPLLNYYQGVSITDGVATVKFTRPALKYLNGPACLQGTVKAPIEDTLLQFPTIKSVQYSIGGKIFDQWDA